MILLKTATETATDFKKKFVVFRMSLLRTATETKTDPETATETQKHNQQTFKKQFRIFSIRFY